MKKILIVDDEPELRSIVRALLEHHGFSVVEAANGKEGIGKLKESVPDLVLCDINMPEMNGFEMLDAVRHQKNCSNIPFIFLSAKDVGSHLRCAMDRGADDYLIKPFSEDDLIHAINIRLNRFMKIKEDADHLLEELQTNISLKLPQDLSAPLDAIIQESEDILSDVSVLQSEALLRKIKSIHRSSTQLHQSLDKFWVVGQIERIASDKKRIKQIRSRPGRRIDPMVTDIARQKAFDVKRESDLVLQLDEIHTNVTDQYMSRMMTELLDNAFNYSPAGSEVLLSTHPKKTVLALKIRDHGTGLTEEELALIRDYKHYDRLIHDPRGLGLTIARRLAEVHGGGMEIDSKKKGTTVIITLPNITSVG